LGQRPNYIGGDIRGGTDDYRTSNLHNYVYRPAFTPNTKGKYGNLGGYVLTGPGNQNFDFSIFKAFKIRERASVQFRASFQRAQPATLATAALSAGTFGGLLPPPCPIFSSG
jgi:hypothetical protein